MIRIWICLLTILLFGSSALAQNTQCPTPAVGGSAPIANGATCASQAFVTDHYPSGATAGHVATFVDNSGQLLSDGGLVPTFAECVPNKQVITATGAFTYTTPSCTIGGQSTLAAYLEIDIQAAGGGGAGSGTSPGNGGAGANSTFGTSLLTANGGGAGTNLAGGSGGSTSGCDADSVSGQSGGNPTGAGNSSGGQGGNSARGFGGTLSGPANLGNAAQAFGGGGSGAGDGATASTGGGGAGGGFCKKLIISPAASYSGALGVAGIGGTAGTGGFAGGNGSGPLLVVTAKWQ